MNFCKKNDEYISLYIDELLDDKTGIEFLEHMKECNECDRKFKEASYFAQLCREGQDMMLPEEFSSCLHKRLLDVSANESKSKLGFFVYNKKFIASLSTAAVLVISLLAYNLLPQIGSKKDISGISIKNAQVEAASSYSGTGENKVIQNKERAAGSAPTDDSQAESNTAIADVQSTVTISEAAPEASKKTDKEASLRSVQGAAEQGSNSQEPINKKEFNEETALYIMKTEDQADTNNQQYFLNYVELNLKVSPGGIEIEELRKFMSEIGAIESKPVTASSIDIDAGAKFNDYYIPLSLYSTLSDQAAKNKLELSTKTDIIKSDNTNRYKELDVQLLEINEKIQETTQNGEDTTILEDQKIIITEEMNKIIAEREMIKVRVFLIDK